MSNKQTKNRIVYFLEESWLLMVSSVVFGCLLAVFNALWSPRIEANQQSKFAQLAGGLLTGAVSFKEAGTFNGITVMKALTADGSPAGWAFVCEGAGFADKIKLVVAVDTAFEKMAGFGVLSSNETPGFGDKITIKPEDGGFYQPQFIGAPVETLTLTKTGDASKIDSEIVAISGATISSEAVVSILNASLLPVKEAMRQQGLLP
ncbi:MAG TPA: FMN-binding protein [Anaerohalosphaeraceae bacterium]|nr:FMN-binding protein [Phycisphaerae bacterium]HOL30380.1 FMN-binding protein [Anaerohalosphaeraceae bacterium]HOM75638.1 FMN-binding protein [Anaerohalosphaeraceae bacterium]HPC63078.1 FMN-binding protein [Anaerohalosphaeraceae bacterium]HPO70599.1 FMN-binding protein [Anaerohalosphaeraceae bacterium]